MHTLIAAKNVSCSANLLPMQDLCPNPNGMDANGFIYLLSTWSHNHLSCLNDIESLKLSRFVPDIPQCTTTVVCKYIIKVKNWHFNDICVPTFVRDISEWKKDDFAWRHIRIYLFYDVILRERVLLSLKNVPNECRTTVIVKWSIVLHR